MAKRANKIRADVVIGTNLITNGTFSKLAQSTSRFDRGIRIVDGKSNRNFNCDCRRANGGADSGLDANLHRYRRACAKSV
jgi:hypothetical protein